MPNRTYAQEWLHFARKNLETAGLLIREQHYTDSIAIEIQQAIEKTLKAVYAYLGNPIPKKHTLMVLFLFAKEKLNLEEFDSDHILAISDYYETDRYPGPRYTLPERSEVEMYFKVAERLFERINGFINT